MRRRHQIILLAAIVTFVCLASALPAFGDSTGTVDAKVSVRASCLKIDWVNGTALDFGTLAFGGGLGMSGSFKVTNCATAAENITARGTDANSVVPPDSLSVAASWSLVEGPRSCPGNSPPNVGPDEFQLHTNLRPDLTGIYLSKTDTLLQTGTAPGSYFADVTLRMPCPGSAGAGQTMNFQIVYTASL